MIGLVARRSEDAHGRLDDILERGSMRKEIELLEHEADSSPLPAQAALALDGDSPILGLAIADALVLHPDGAGVGYFEVIEAAEERRLAGTRGADDANDLAFLDFERDPADDLLPGEGFADVGRPQDGRVLGRWF